MTKPIAPVIDIDQPDTFHDLNIKELILIDKELAELEEQIETLKKRRLTIEEDLKLFFANTGLTNIKTTSNITLKLNRQIFASKVGGCDMEYFIKKLKKAGLSEFVKQTFSTSQLSAWIREREKEKGKLMHDNWNEILPNELKGLVNIFEKITVSTSGIKPEGEKT